MKHYKDAEFMGENRQKRSQSRDLVDYVAPSDLANDNEIVQANRWFSPLRVLIITIAGIFLAEVIAMIVIYLLEPLPYFYLALLDASIMTLLIFPVIYFLSFRPLLRYAIRREQVAQAIRRPYERLRELEFIINQSPAIAFHCLLKDGWSIEFVSQNVSQLGYTPEELLSGGLKLDEFIHPDDLPWVIAEVSELIHHGGGDFVKEFRVRTPAGKLRWLEGHIWMIRNDENIGTHFQGVAMDITERKKAEELVQLERDKLKGILDAMPDGVYILNQKYEFEYINPVIENEFGPVNGQKCYKYFHNQPEVCSWCVNDQVFSGQSVRWEHLFANNNKTYELFDTPFKNEDGSLSKLQILHDITKRKQNEEALKNTNQELQVLTEVERQQHQLTEILLAASLEFTESLELDHVLNALLDFVGRLIPYDNACISLLDAESQLTTHAMRGRDRCKVPTGLVLQAHIQNDDSIMHTVFTKQESLLIQDTSNYPGWQVNPAIEHIHSWLGVPIVASDKVIGLLELCKDNAGFFTETHAQWSGALAGQAAVAIQNAWLFEQIRTTNERLQSLSRKLVEVQESERRYIARELHDEASQALTSLMLDLHVLEKGDQPPELVLLKALEMENTLKTVLENLHHLAKDLRPAILDHLGLEATLRQTAQTIQEKYGIQVKIQLSGIEERLPDNFETAIYRIVKEALNNVVRHANATIVDVILSLRDDNLILVIEDDGDGFDPLSNSKTGRLGLFGMQERTEMLGGTLLIDSEEGKGTTLVVEVPYVNQDIDR